MASKRFSVLFALLCVVIPAAAIATAGALTGNLEAFRVVQHDGKETFLSADEAKPRDLIEYRLTYTNTGSDPIQNVLITDPIPSGTQYVADSTTQPGTAEVVFSIDGGRTYETWPIKIVRKDKNGNEQIVEATPSMVTHIRWRMGSEFAPQGKVTVSYRTLIK